MSESAPVEETTRSSSISTPWKRGRLRARCDHDVLGLKDGLALFARDDDAARAVDAARAEIHRHLVLLHDEGDAIGEPGHRVGLLLQHVLEVELEARDLDAEAGEILAGRLVEFGGVQQRLGGNAAHD